MKKMVLRILFPAPFLCFMCLSAQADTVAYHVTVDTSSQSGNYGYVDLQLNQGTLAALPITASITSNAVKGLMLKKGGAAYAVIKASSVLVGVD